MMEEEEDSADVPDAVASAIEDEDTGLQVSNPVSSSTSGQQQQQQEVQEQHSQEGGGGDGADGAAGNDADDDDDESTAPPDDSPSLSEDLYGDDVSTMTYGRRLAKYLSQYSWYYPYEKQEAKYREAARRDRDFEEVHVHHDDDDGCERDADGVHHVISFRDADDDKPPSLDAAWAYFEHVVLPRHFVRSEDATAPSSSDGGGGIRQSLTKTASVFTMSLEKTNDKYQRAEPGETERPTALYPIWDTPEEQLADFGIGVGLYFNSLKVLSIILAVAGLICIPAMKFYSGTEYTVGGQVGLFEGGLAGSAICTDQRWVACPTCKPKDWEASFPPVGDRYAEMESDNGEKLSFILKNFCEVQFHPGLFLFIALLFVTVSIFLYGLRTERKEIDFDEAQQTTTDYSIEVMYPPKDARDPEEWRDFFTRVSGEHVTVCTIALDNEELVRALLARRQKYMHLEMFMPTATKLRRNKLKEQVATMPKVSWWKRLYMACMHMAFSPRMVYNAIQQLERRIEELSKKEYDVSHVFVTFETEAAQREVLTKLDTPYRNVKKNNLSAMPEELRFRGKHVLWVQEPPEPDAVRWQDLDDTFVQRVKQQTITVLLTLICVGGGGAIIAAARRRSAAVAAITIIILNSLTPIVVKQIVKFESHPDAGSMQTSLYVKMTILRWFNTAIITTIITPFTNTLTNGPDYLLQSIYAIFFAELVKTPILQVTDYMSNLKRHFFGPRIFDRRFRAEQFAGGYWTLAERMTDMTKVMFLTFYYAIVFPASFFFASGTLLLHYWTDKFCILRCWQRAPLIGTNLAKFSRFYIYPLLMLTYALTLAYNYGSFPFDMACELDTAVSEAYVMDDATATNLDGDPVSVTIEEGDPQYEFCFMNLVRYKPPAFPPLPGKVMGDRWMTDGQQRMLIILGWTLVAIFIWVGCVYVNRIVIAYIRENFFKSYKPSGKAMEHRFSDLPEIFGYVPMVKLYGSNYPALIADISTIDEGLIGWSDPLHSYDRHNMLFDVPSVRKKILQRRESLARGDPQRSGEEERGRKASIFSIVCDWPPRPPPPPTRKEDVGEDHAAAAEVDAVAEDEGI